MVVTDPGQGLACIRERRFEMLQRVDGSGQRPLEPAGELGRGARFTDAGEHRFDGAVIRSAVAVQRVGRAATRMTGCVPVLPVPDDFPEHRRFRARATGWARGSVVQAVMSPAASWWKVAQGRVV